MLFVFDEGNMLCYGDEKDISAMKFLLLHPKENRQL